MVTPAGWRLVNWLDFCFSISDSAKNMVPLLETYPPIPYNFAWASPRASWGRPKGPEGVSRAEITPPGTGW